jgi:hypothetical protein
MINFAYLHGGCRGQAHDARRKHSAKTMRVRWRNRRRRDAAWCDIGIRRSQAGNARYRPEVWMC